MPELPEVETVKRAMSEAALGSTITSVWVSGQKMRWPIPENIGALLTNAEIFDLRRRGKYIIMECGEGKPETAVIFHLGMSGSVRIYPQHDLPERKKHDHLIIKVTKKNAGHYLVLNDPRRFGGVAVTKAGQVQNHPLLKSMGVEPLGNELSGQMMRDAFIGKTSAIKTLLLDQQIIAGIGNIYASEALYLAGISPRRQAKNVTIGKLDALNQAIRAVLTKAIEAGGTSLRDHVQPGGEIGYFVQQLNVYGKEGENCSQCGALIKMIRQTGRASFYCPGCQR